MKNVANPFLFTQIFCRNINRYSKLLYFCKKKKIKEEATKWQL